MTSEYFQKNAVIFECKLCAFKCCKKSNYNAHLLTLKHKNTAIDCKKNADVFSCICGNNYKHRQSLYSHKKVCKKQQKNGEVDCKKNVEVDCEVDGKLDCKKDVNLLVIKLLNQNAELQKMLIEQSKNINSNNTVINSNNNFNLNVFLNDKCKDALNLADFVEGLKVELKDLEETARVGYTEGVSRIFINGLNELEVNKRPIHCSDAKRETLYIKDDNEWSKEDTDKSHISKAIKRVSNKNIQQIFEWQKKYPEYKDPESKESDKYMEMICNTMSGSSKEEQLENVKKIIKNISKETVIDKLAAIVA